MKAQLEVMKGAMLSLSNGSATGSLEALGILQDDMALVTGAIPWTANQRTHVTRTIDALLFGTLDILGLPRFQIPAEYVGACIVMFVNPTNLLVACRWMEAGQPTVDSLGNPTSSSANRSPVEASQLFALAMQLVNHSTVATCRSQFESRTKLSIVKSIGDKTHAQGKK